MRSASSALIPAVSAVAAVLAACSGSDETVLPPEAGTSGCDQAFDQAAREPSTPRLQLTLVACDGIGDWVPEAASHPDLVPTDDEIRFAATICATTVAVDVRRSKTCVQALGRRPEIRHRPLPTTTG